MLIILPIVALFLFGFAARRFLTDPTSLVKWLNRFIVYIAMPAVILLKVPQLRFSIEMIVPAGVAWAWLLLGAAIVLALSRALKWPRPTEGAMLLLVTMGNTSFLGFPMVLAFFNDAVLAYAIFFDQLGGFLILSTFGLLIIAIYSPSPGAKGRGVRILEIIHKICTFPPFIALLIALFVPLENVMLLFASSFELLTKLLMPAALFVLGVQFQPKLLAEHRVPLISGIALKMLLAPILATLLLAGLGISGEVRTASIFEAAMPCMITPGLMAINAGIAPRFIATLLGYSTVFAFISLPVLAWMLA